MKNNWISTAACSAIVALLGLLPIVAEASIISSGSQLVTFSANHTATVDYAVYQNGSSPQASDLTGSFHKGFNSLSIQSNALDTAAGHYLYLYEVTNNSAGNGLGIFDIPIFNTAFVTSFGWFSKQFDGSHNAVATSGSFVTPNNDQLFLGTPGKLRGSFISLGAGVHTILFGFTSDHSPTTGIMNLSSPNGSASVPTISNTNPIPEPSTLVLTMASMSLFGLFGFRRSRKTEAVAG